MGFNCLVIPKSAWSISWDFWWWWWWQGRNVFECDNMFLGCRFKFAKAQKHLLDASFGVMVWWHGGRGLELRQAFWNDTFLPETSSISANKDPQTPQCQTVLQMPEEKRLKWKRIWAMRWEKMGGHLALALFSRRWWSAVDRAAI